MAALAGACVWSAPAAADEPVRPSERDYGEYPPSSTRSTLVIAGLATSAVWYGLGVGMSYAWPDAPGAADLRIPIAGPWMALPETECFDEDDDCSVVLTILRVVMLGIDGVGQAGGLAVAAEGLFLPTTASEPIGKIRQAQSDKTAPRILAAPSSLGADAAGLVVFGRF
jgi:hypothetical protein